MKTETEFPVDTGTTITVSCQEGYTMTGGDVVTCNTYLYQDFEFAMAPYCSLGKHLGQYQIIFKQNNLWLGPPPLGQNMQVLVQHVTL